MVSGSHFFPNAPLLCVKWMPACVVTARKWICWAWLAVIASKSRIHHGDTEARRKLRQNFILIPRLPGCWTLAGLCPAGQPRRLSPHVSRKAPAAAPKRAREPPDARCCLRDAAGDMVL